MEEKRLDAAESLALIGRMIENTRNNMERNAGRPFLVWGYVTLLTTLLVWGTVVQTGEPRWNLLWLLIPLLGGTLTYFTRGKRTEGRVHTFVDRVLGSVWLVAGLTASFLSLVALFTPIRLPILFVILLTMGMGTAATGLILRFRPAACCGAAAHPARPGHADRAQRLAAGALRRGIPRHDDRPGTHPQLPLEPPQKVTGMEENDKNLREKEASEPIVRIFDRKSCSRN